MSQFSKLSVEDIPVEEYDLKRVIVRVDFNVPMDEEGNITDDTRMQSSLKTILFLLEKKIKCLTIISHLGRPKGKPNPSLSLAKVASYLGNLIKKEVVFVPELKLLAEKTRNCENGTVFFLENIRFYSEEESKNTDSEEVKKFRIDLTECGDIFVNEAFACCHRAHSSMVGINCGKRVAGYLVLKEIEYFGRALTNPPKPFLAILGGKKVDTKIAVIECLLDKVDEMIICGGMAYTFKKVCDGMDIGMSIFDKKGAGVVKGYLEKAKEKGVKVHLPIDFVCTDDFGQPKNVIVREAKDGIPEKYEGIDIGPQIARTLR